MVIGQPRMLYLVDLYSGEVICSFGDADQLVAYLKKKKEGGTLRGESAYAVFWGHHLSISNFWESAFGSKKEVNP